MKAKTPFVSIRNLKNQALIADKCFVAARFFDRLWGLSGRRNFPSGEAMLFPACRDIQVWFMRIPIDVVFLRRVEPEQRPDGVATKYKDRLWRVSSAHARVKPRRILPIIDWRGEQALELPEGSIEKFGIQAGDDLCIG